MALTKVKNFNYSRVRTGKARNIINSKSFSFDVHYGEDEGPLLVQLPRSQVFSGLFESDGKFYCEILIPSDGAASRFYFEVAARIEASLKRQERFARSTFVGHVRVSSPESSCLRIKLPQNKANITTSLYSEGKDQRPGWDAFHKGAHIIPVVGIDHAYVVNNTIGFNLLLKEAVICSKMPP
tara:strand:+ start:98 stop:643 length:546 start_codon:yes stop_codon:yes gene_type:complete